MAFLLSLTYYPTHIQGLIITSHESFNFIVKNYDSAVGQRIDYIVQGKGSAGHDAAQVLIVLYSTKLMPDIKNCLFCTGQMYISKWRSQSIDFILQDEGTAGHDAAKVLIIFYRTKVQKEHDAVRVFIVPIIQDEGTAGHDAAKICLLLHWRDSRGGYSKTICNMNYFFIFLGNSLFMIISSYNMTCMQKV